MRTLEQQYNAGTHAVGVLAAALGGAFLITLCATSGDARLIVGAAVFVAAMILLYSASTLYHFAVHQEVARRLKVFDHAAIYILIAGSYTPFTIAGIRGPWGWTLFGVIWGCAAAGLVFKLFFTGRFRGWSTATYIVMGWLIVIAIGPMRQTLSSGTLFWLCAGGITYTLGTIFYLSKRRYAHTLWHLFVLGGSTCHAIAVGTLV